MIFRFREENQEIFFFQRPAPYSLGRSSGGPSLKIVLIEIVIGNDGTITARSSCFAQYSKTYMTRIRHHGSQKIFERTGRRVSFMILEVL